MISGETPDHWWRRRNGRDDYGPRLAGIKIKPESQLANINIR